MLACTRFLRKSLSFTSVLQKQNQLLLPALSTHKFLHISNALHNKEDEQEEELKANPFFEKYEEKIKKAKAAGVYIPKKEMPNKRLQREANQWKESIAKVEEKLLERKEKQTDNRGSKLPNDLNELIHMDLFMDKNKEEITKIWAEYFKSKDAISAVIPVDTYKVILERSKDCPMFLACSDSMHPSCVFPLTFSPPDQHQMFLFHHHQTQIQQPTDFQNGREHKIIPLRQHEKQPHWNWLT